MNPSRDNYIRAAYWIFDIAPQALKRYIVDSGFPGGILQVFSEYADQIKDQIPQEEWVKLQEIKDQQQHRLYQFKDDITDECQLDRDVMDFLISRCVLSIEDRKEVARYGRQSDKNRLILDLLINKPFDTFDIFVEALRVSDVVPGLINRMKTGHVPINMESSISQRVFTKTHTDLIKLQKNYRELVHNISSPDNVVDILVSKFILTPEDSAEITSIPTDYEKNRKLLEKIKTEEDLIGFLEAMKEDHINGELALQVEFTEVTEMDKQMLQTVTRIHDRELDLQTLLTVVSIVRGVQMKTDYPTEDDVSIEADLFRLQTLYKHIIEADAMEKESFQQFHGMLSQVICRLSGRESTKSLDLRISFSPYVIKKLQERLKHEKDKTKLRSITKTVADLEAEKGYHLPRQSRDQIQKQLEKWEEEDRKFVSTRASEQVLQCSYKQNCVTITGPPGSGKKFIAHHTALVLQKEGYTIIPVVQPSKLEDFYFPNKQTVFVIDNVCGTLDVSPLLIDEWKRFESVVLSIKEDTKCKLIVSCRLQVYRDEQFSLLSFFKSCECNLVSDELCLTKGEKLEMAEMHLQRIVDDDELSGAGDFFPLLCTLYARRKDSTLKINDFFRNPFSVYKKELGDLECSENKGKYKICCLVLCVLFNNKLSKEWLQTDTSAFDRQVLDEVAQCCGLGLCLSKVGILKAVDSLLGTYITFQDEVYCVIHDKLFDFLAFHFSQEIHRKRCMIKYANFDLLSERFIISRFTKRVYSVSEFIIDVPKCETDLFFGRMKSEWFNGNVAAVFTNINMTFSDFRLSLMQYISKLGDSEQNQLINMKDSVLPADHWRSGITVLMIVSDLRYMEMLHWIFDKDIEVNLQNRGGQTMLNKACIENNIVMVRRLLDKKADINLSDRNSNTPLVAACRREHWQIVRLLLDVNADINLCNKKGESPLYHACKHEQIDIVLRILKKNPDVNKCSIKLESPLYLACFKDNEDIANELLKYGPNINERNTNGETPLLCACMNDNEKIVTILLEKGADVYGHKKDGETPIYWACYNDNCSIVTMLLERGANVNLADMSGLTPLILTCQKNKPNAVNIVKTLFRNGAEVNVCLPNGENALISAVSVGSTSLVKLLLTNRAISNSRLLRKDELSFVSEDLLEDITQSLCKRLVRRVSVQHNTLREYLFGSHVLHLACILGDIDIVKQLVEFKANVNIAKDDGTTPLFFACEFNHGNIVEFLIHKGARIDVQRQDGKQPLDLIK